MTKPSGKLLFAYQTIASLEQKLEAAQARVADLEQSQGAEVFLTLTGEITQLKAKLEELGNQEPVAIVDAGDDGYWAEILPDRTVKVGQELFAYPVAQAGQVPAWVACTERLPESGEPVIVWCSGSSQAGVAWIRQGAWLMPEPQALGYESITHWAPLPAAPAQGASTDE